MNPKNNVNNLNVFVTGGNGFIGSHIIRTLKSAGYKVTACVRYPHNPKNQMSGVHKVYGDFMKDLHESDWIPRLKGIDIVINAAGIIRESPFQSFGKIHRDGPIALFNACEKVGVKKVIQISALGADDSAFSRYHISKRDADDHLLSLKIDGVILQPSIVYGPGGKSMAFFKALAALPLIPLVNSGNQRIQPIYIDDLTRAVVQSIESTKLTRQKIALVGPVSIPIRDLLSDLRLWLGLVKPRFCSVPYPLALGAAGLAKLFRAPLLTPV